MALQAMLDAFVGLSGKRRGPTGKSADDPVAKQICIEVTAALDEMKLVLRRNMTVPWEFGERGEVRRSRSASNTNPIGHGPRQLAGRRYDAHEAATDVDVDTLRGSG